MKRYTTLLFSLLFVLCLSVAPSAKAASAQDEVLQVVTNWTKAMNTADFELWSSLHWNSPKTSSFAPPKSAAFLIQGYEAVLNNMRFLFECPQGTMNSSHHNPQVTMLKDDVAVVTLYRILTLNPPAVKEQTTVQERQTLVVQKIDGKWLIVHDHGSVLPKE
jgi:uncharacterized protein (TIGR02246 family)